MTFDPPNPAPPDPPLGLPDEPAASPPPPRMEWILAAMIGLGVALGGAGAVAYVESRRYGPVPPAEEGANEWATPRPRPAKSSQTASASAELPNLELEAPIIDVDIEGSAGDPAGSSRGPLPE